MQTKQIQPFIFNSGSYEKYPDGKKYAHESFLPSKINIPYIFNDMRIASLLEEASAQLADLNRYSYSIPNIDFFIGMHILNEAINSSDIEGIHTTMEDAVLPEKKIAPEQADNVAEVRSYTAALQQGIEMMETLPISTRLLKEIHKVLMTTGRGDKLHLGQIRKTQNWVGGDNFKTASFVPPHHNHLKDLLTDLELFWHNCDLSIPNLIKIALFHYQFETIHPFTDGNGRLGRIAIILQLIELGILEQPILHISNFFKRNRISYYDSLTAVREKNDMNQWVIFFLNSIVETSKIAKKRLTKIMALCKRYEKRIARLGRRSELAHELLSILYYHPVIDTGQVVEALEISERSALYLLKNFQGLGLLHELTGQKRHRLFSLYRYIRIFEE